LDEGDNDPARFLAYLVAALQSIGIGEGVLGMLEPPQPAPTESILVALINEIANLSDEFVLVLDDYHVVDAEAVDHVLTFLLEHVPPKMHLVIATREDPQLPLARLRALGQLTELRAADLRFTSSEAAAFLEGVMGLSISAEEIAALETRTEGWIAGLQLAALSMQGRDDVPTFIRAFAGDNRYVLDYLVEEVLGRQPERVRTFLLQTSILERLSGPLCDAVTDQEEGNARLEALERGNFFVVPLDDKRRWYRYHHLFADVLYAHLTQEHPDRVPTLHRRASEWYEQNGLPADAIRHALAAEDFERAAGLVEMAWPAMDGRFQAATWLGWVEALPDELVRTRPVLGVGYAWALLDAGELEAADTRLRDAELWLGASAVGSGRPVVVDEEQYRSLPASIAAARAYHALALGNVAGAAEYARRALDLLPEEGHIQRGQAGALLGLARWTSGDLEAAHQSLADAMAHFRMAGNFHFAISGTYGLADIRMTQGRLREAVRTYERSLRLALEQGEPLLRGTAELYLGLGELHHEQGDPESATQHLLRSEELGEKAALPNWPNRR
jgi:LuxR family maltose regulon positive regulatory protein